MPHPDKSGLAITSLRGALLQSNLITGLYIITARDSKTGRSHLDICLAALKGGARIIQYRQKGGSYNNLLKEASELKKLCQKYQALLIVNDHVQPAIDIDADGLHMGQNDMDIFNARKLIANKIIGLSTHSLIEAKQAQSLNPDYISVGPVFYTNSKTDASPPIGLETLREIKKNSNVPVVAIGGINKENAPAVCQTGVDAIAVISAISQAEDMIKATRELKEIATPLLCNRRGVAMTSLRA